MRRETYTSEDDNVRVSQLLCDFSDGPGNAVNVFRDKSTRLTSCITFQTAFMRRMARKFPEALCIDATYGTNINRYRLFSFMVTDKFGCDFTDLALLQDEFPDATIILCYFHVIDYLKKKVSKKNYGFTNYEKIHVKNLLTLMVRSETEESFDHYLSALKMLCAKRPAFLDYFEENWLKCKELWCTFKRGDIPHLDNNTNNRLEASWGAAKDILHRHMAMDECIDHLLFLQQSAEDAYGAKVKRVGYRYNHEYDDEMNVLAKFATRHACDLVEDQYKVSGKATYRLSADEMTPAYVTLTSERSGNTFAVSVVENKCSCSFHQTLLLPCRHMMYLRRQSGECRSVIPYDMIPERWLIADAETEDDINANTTHIFAVKDVEVFKGRVLGHNEKYRAGFAVCQKIAEVIADKGSRSFHRWLSYLVELEKVARLDGNVPGSLGAKIQSIVPLVGDTVTNSKVVGYMDTNSEIVGEDNTNSAIVGDSDGEDTTDLASIPPAVDQSDILIAAELSAVGVDDTNSETNSGLIGGAATSSEHFTKPMAPRTTKRRLNLLAGNEDSGGQDQNVIVELNTSSKPSGRPREKRAAKKAKSRKEFEDTKALADQLNSIGDVTLATLRQCIDKKNHSFSAAEPVLSAIRPMFQTAIYKIPKARVINPEEAIQFETNVRYVLPEVLVNKSAEAGKNAIIRESAKNHQSTANEAIAISILDVGTFSLDDINTMKEWHILSRKIASVRMLIKWVKERPDSEERATIIAKLPHMNMYTEFKAGIGETVVKFDDLTNFAGTKWLLDGSVFVAALHTAQEARRGEQNSGGVDEVIVVDSVFLGFQVEDERTRLLDTERKIFSKGAKGRVILVPINIAVDIAHWCAAIVDFRSRIIWIYDPKQKSGYIQEVETIVTNCVVPIIDPAFKFIIKKSTSWFQKDGYNCGVFVVKWFETYIKVAMNTQPEDDLQTLTPRFMSDKDLDECRYQMFKTIFLDICKN